MPDTVTCGAPLRHPEHPYVDATGTRVPCDGSPNDTSLSLSHYDHRTQTVAQIRALADWMELHPDLPGAADVVVHIHLDKSDPGALDRFTGLVRQYASEDEIGEGTVCRWVNIHADDRRERGGIHARVTLYGPLEPASDPYDDDQSAIESLACDS